MKRILVLLISAAALTLFTAGFPLRAEDQQLSALIHEFMDGASRNDAAVHQRFWAEDLVYTSSAGKRFGKAEILAGMSPQAEPSGVIYSAEDLQLRRYGDIAVATFRLQALAADGSTEQFYNSGVFLLDDGQWRAFTWQATRAAAD